jgi:hypothetical protein
MMHSNAQADGVPCLSTSDEVPDGVHAARRSGSHRADEALALST